MNPTGGRPDEPDADDFDRRFREIVAHLGRADQSDVPPTAPGTSEPDQSNPPDLPTTGEAPPADADSWLPPAEPTAAQRPRHLGPGTPEGMATDFRSYEPPEFEEDDHFIPPPTPPLPVGDLHFWAILICLVVGPALILGSVVLPILGRGWSVVGLVASVLGFILLVLRQPKHRDHYEGDSGAQV